VPAAPSNQENRRLAIFALAVILVVAGAAVLNAVRNWQASAAARKLKNPVPTTPEVIAIAKQDYTEHCRNCHGEKGDGKGERAAELSVAPGDFTDAKTMSGRTDGELYWQITRGRLPMPAFEDKLTDQQRWQLVDYIRTFAAK
jgi:mono/diheme cytochrome c family protein